MSLHKRLYVLDFAGGGAVHLLGKLEFMCILLPLSLFMGQKSINHPSIYIYPRFSLKNDFVFLFFFSAGGMAALMVCLFARFQEWWDNRERRAQQVSNL